MKIILGPEPLTAHELGAKLWNAEYRGKSIGQWAKEAWRETLLDAPHHMPGNSPVDVLGELGLLATRAPQYIYIMQLYKLSELLPELRPYVSTLFTWEGVYPQGRPYLKSPEGLADAERLEAAIRNAAASRKAYSKRGDVAPAAPEPVAPAKARKAKPEPTLEPAESSVPPTHTATVIQFPGRR